MSKGVTQTYSVHMTRTHKGAGRLREGDASPAIGLKPVPPGRVPRVARLAALAVKFDGLVRRGEVEDYAALARLGHVSRARLTQVMNLVLLAPDVLEAILFLPNTEKGRDSINEHDLRHVASTPNWAEQRRRWQKLIGNES